MEYRKMTVAAQTFFSMSFLTECLFFGNTWLFPLKYVSHSNKVYYTIESHRKRGSIPDR